MTRRIRFRARDSRSGRIFSADELGRDEMTINPDGRGFVNVNGRSPALSEYYEHLEPEQFTGRVDSAGVEIYENDRVDVHASGRGLVTWDAMEAAWTLFEFRGHDSPYRLGDFLTESLTVVAE